MPRIKQKNSRNSSDMNSEATNGSRGFKGSFEKNLRSAKKMASDFGHDVRENKIVRKVTDAPTGVQIGAIAAIAAGGYALWANRAKIGSFLKENGIKTEALRGEIGEFMSSTIAKVTGSRFGNSESSDDSDMDSDSEAFTTPRNSSTNKGANRNNRSASSSRNTN